MLPKCLKQPILCHSIYVVPELTHFPTCHHLPLSIAKSPWSVALQTFLLGLPRLISTCYWEKCIIISLRRKHSAQPFAGIGLEHKSMFEIWIGGDGCHNSASCERLSFEGCTKEHKRWKLADTTAVGGLPLDSVYEWGNLLQLSFISSLAAVQLAYSGVPDNLPPTEGNGTFCQVL